MAVRLLHEGSDTTYEYLRGELNPGEQLMASFKKGQARTLTVEPVTDEATFDRIADGTYDHKLGAHSAYDYFEVRWHASTDGSLRPADYGRPGI